MQRVPVAEMLVIYQLDLLAQLERELRAAHHAIRCIEQCGIRCAAGRARGLERAARRPHDMIAMLTRCRCAARRPSHEAQREAEGRNRLPRGRAIPP